MDKILEYIKSIYLILLQLHTIIELIDGLESPRKEVHKEISEHLLKQYHELKEENHV